MPCHVIEASGRVLSTIWNQHGCNGACLHRSDERTDTPTSDIISPQHALTLPLFED